MSAIRTTTTETTRTYAGPGAAPMAAYRADDWLARKQWLGISSCGWILIAIVAIVVILLIISAVGALSRRR